MKVVTVHLLQLKLLRAPIDIISLVNDASSRCVGDTCSHYSAITHYKKLRRACLWFKYVYKSV